MYEVIPLKGINEEKIIYDNQLVKNIIPKINIKLHKLKPRYTAKESIILDSFNSATIEGARTTLEKVKKYINNPVNKNDVMVVNNIRALNKIYSGYKITDDNIREFWEILIEGVCENISSIGTKYRSKMVYVASQTKTIHTPTPIDRLEEYMGELLKYINTNYSIESAIISHFYFVYIHPFCDGNGRMARIIQNYVLFNAGYTNITKLDVSGSIRNKLTDYYKALVRSEEKRDKKYLNITPFIVYMLNCIKDACIKCETSLNKNEIVLYEKMKKRGIKSEITTENASKALKTDRDTARNILNSLTKKGLLSKKKNGKINIYILTRII